MNEYDWGNAPKRYLKAEMAKYGITQIELAERLTKLGIPETKSTVAKKLSRGTFSGIFLFQCLKAMNINYVNLTDAFFIPTGKKDEKNT